MANGILIIDKPAGWTSHDVVAKLRGLLRERRIGHAGTLDPMATGVLPVFVGRATRAVEFAAEREKEYLAGLRLGVVTDTQDTTGTVLETHPVCADRPQVEAVLARFRGAKWGDGAYDFNPIADLTVTEIYEFLTWLHAPENIIRKAPSAGLFEGQTDEQEMGVSYAAIDKYILTGEANEHDKAIIDRYHSRSEHKRRPAATYHAE